jgi:hypothetical protein
MRVSALERPSQGNTQDLARAGQPCDRGVVLQNISVYCTAGRERGRHRRRPAAWKGAAKGVGLEAPASGNRKLEREHTRPSFDGGDVRIAATGKTKLALEAPSLEPRLSTLRPSATGSPTCRERLFPPGCPNIRAPARREKLGGACRFPGKRRQLFGPLIPSVHNRGVVAHPLDDVPLEVVHVEGAPLRPLVICGGHP